MRKLKFGLLFIIAMCIMMFAPLTVSAEEDITKVDLTAALDANGSLTNNVTANNGGYYIDTAYVNSYVVAGMDGGTFLVVNLKADEGHVFTPSTQYYLNGSDVTSYSSLLLGGPVTSQTVQVPYNMFSAPPASYQVDVEVQINVNSVDAAPGAAVFHFDVTGVPNYTMINNAIYTNGNGTFCGTVSFTVPDHNSYSALQNNGFYLYQYAGNSDWTCDVSAKHIIWTNAAVGVDIRFGMEGGDPYNRMMAVVNNTYNVISTPAAPPRKELQIPLTVQVVQGGEDEAPDAVFHFEVSDLPEGSYELIQDVVYTSGTQMSHGTLTLACSEEEYAALLGKGFTLKECSAVVDGWHFDEEIWYAEIDSDGVITYTSESTGKEASEAAFTNFYSMTDGEEVEIPLGKPKKLSVIPTEDGNELTWKKVDGAVGYIVYAKEDGGSFKKLKKVSGLTYLHEDADNGSEYTYKVTAYGKLSDGSTYNAEKSSKKTTVYLDKPTIKVSADEESITVTVSKNEEADEYIVYYGTEKDIDEAEEVHSDSAKITIEDLDSDETYYVWAQTCVKTKEGTFYSPLSKMKKVDVE